MTQITTPETEAADASTGFAPIKRLDTGLHTQVPEPVYHADPAPQPSLSSSLARTLLYESPAHAWQEHPRLRGKSSERESTLAMNLGSIVHALLAGEEAMKQSLEIGHFPDYRTAAAKEWKAEVIASGRTPLLEKDLLGAGDVAHAVRLTLPGLFSQKTTAQKELTAVWQDIGGHYCRARIDCLQRHETGGASIWDWKTASDVSDRALERACQTYRYPFQLAFYLRGLRKLLPEVTAWDAKLVFVEATAPHTVRLVSFSEEYMAYAASEVEKAIERWADCMSAEDFSDPRHGEQLTLELPDWLIDEPEIIVE